MQIFLGFDFYGAGNIGDDLMLAGFLTLIPEEYSITCVIPRSPASQEHRFPRITWIQGKDEAREDAIRQCDLWIGVGATPFSAVHRAWLLRHMERDLTWCRRLDKPVALVGVDADERLLHSDYRELAAKTLKQCRIVVTRDQNSVDVLRALVPEPEERLVPGIDLANFYLAQRAPQERNLASRQSLGVCYWEETMQRRQLKALRLALRRLRREGERIVFFANEVRPEFDHAVYRRVTTLRDRWHGRNPMRFESPDHAGGNLADLIAHFSTYHTVVSSRYHALLVAAWMGCRVLALGQRPKVALLARDLEIPLVCPPWNPDDCHAGILGAVSPCDRVQRRFQDRRSALQSHMSDVISLC